MRLRASTRGVRNPWPLPWWRALARRVLLAARRPDLARHSEVSLVLSGSRFMRALNRRHRGVDRDTDVLSFPQWKGRVPRSEAGMVPLGDVVVCLPRLRRQAREAGRSDRAEAALLFVHGLLHLLGYDHATRRGEREMFSLQKRVLTAVRED